MPILDGSDDGDFYPEDIYDPQDTFERYWDTYIGYLDAGDGETDAYPSELDRHCG